MNTAVLSQKYLRYALYLVAFIIIVAITIGLFSLTGLSNQLVRSNLSGRITSTTGDGIPGAVVSIADREAITDNTGQFEFRGLGLGTYTMSVTADGFATTTLEVSMGMGVFGLENVYDLELEPVDKASLVGTITVPDNPGYNFADDIIMLDNQVYPLNIDGSFEITELDAGSAIFQYKSPNYTNLTREIELESGENLLTELAVLPAGEIVGSLLSYIRQDVVTDMQIRAEGVSQDQIEIDLAENIFRINDLEINRTYKIRITHPQYVDREYEQVATQGQSTLFGYKLVEEGRLAYLNKPDRYIELVSAEFDGENQRQHTDNNAQPYAEYFDNDGTVYFLSTRDGVSNRLGGRALLAYAVDSTAGNAQRITTNTQNIGQVYPNFSAKQLINLTAKNRDRSDRVIELMDLTGNSRRQIFELTQTGEVYDLKSSENGKYIAFAVQTSDGDRTGLYRVDTVSGIASKLTSKIPTEVIDISADGSRILYSTRNQQTELTDLYLFTPENGQDKRVLTAYTGSHYQFMGDSNSELIFFATRNENSNVFTLNVDSNETKRLTNFTQTEGVEALYQQQDLIVYQTNSGLYVMDFTKPVHGVLVTTEFSRYTGFDF